MADDFILYLAVVVSGDCAAGEAAHVGRASFLGLTRQRLYSSRHQLPIERPLATHSRDAGTDS